MEDLMEIGVALIIGAVIGILAVMAAIEIIDPDGKRGDGHDDGDGLSGED